MPCDRFSVIIKDNYDSCGAGLLLLSCLSVSMPSSCRDFFSSLYHILFLCDGLCLFDLPFWLLVFALELSWCKYWNLHPCTEASDCWDLRKSLQRWRTLTHRYHVQWKAWYLRLRLIFSIFPSVSAFMSEYYRLLQGNTLTVALYMHIALYNIALFAAVSLVHFSSFCDPLYIHPPYCAITLLLSVLLSQMDGVWGDTSQWPTNRPLLPSSISHLASRHTELVTRYVTTTVLVRITPYASGRAVACRLAPKINTIDSQEGHLLSCVW